MRTTAFGRFLGLVVAGSAALFLNGCMMLLHGGMHGSLVEDRTEAETVLVTEVQRGEILISVESPPLWVGRTATLAFTVTDLSRKNPVLGAEVRVSLQRQETVGGGASKVVEGRARESAPGAYEFSHTFAESGWYEITVAVQNMAGAGEAPLFLATQREVVQASGQIERGHHSGTDPRAALIIGGAVMAAMMLFML